MSAGPSNLSSRVGKNFRLKYEELFAILKTGMLAPEVKLKLESVTRHYRSIVFVEIKTKQKTEHLSLWKRLFSLAATNSFGCKARCPQTGKAFQLNEEPGSAWIFSFSPGSNRFGKDDKFSAT